jgi:hypothetical protein
MNILDNSNKTQFMPFLQHTPKKSSNPIESEHKVAKKSHREEKKKNQKNGKFILCGIKQHRRSKKT